MPDVQQLAYNTDSEFDSKCIKAGYYKFGLGNCLYHPVDGFVCPCVIEFELEEIENGTDRENTDDMW